MAEEKKKTGLQLFNQTLTNPKTQEYLSQVLGERKGSFVNNLTALVANNAMLQECEPFTLMFAAMKATALNLPLDNSLGFAYVLPYKDNKRGITVAQFQLGYKAYKQLALRSGMFAKIPNATDVREGELLKRDRLTGDCIFKFEDDDKKREALPIIGFVSFFRLLNGAESIFYMSKEEMEAHALRYSQTYRSKDSRIKSASKWTTDFTTMALKTVIKLNLSKNAPLCVELQDAIKADQSVQFEKDRYDYLDNDGDGAVDIDMAKAQEIANKFADFDDAEDVTDKADGKGDKKGGK